MHCKIDDDADPDVEVPAGQATHAVANMSGWYV